MLATKVVENYAEVLRKFRTCSEGAVLEIKLCDWRGHAVKFIYSNPGGIGSGFELTGAMSFDPDFKLLIFEGEAWGYGCVSHFSSGT